jgi:hypothetical protein
LLAKLILKMAQPGGFTKGNPGFCPLGRIRRSKIFPILLSAGRFKSQVLLNEAAFTAYVDLNPIRAKVADTPENSDYISAQQRIRWFKSAIGENSIVQPAELLPFVSNPREPKPDGLPSKLDDDLELAGRSCASCVRGGIRESIHVHWNRRIVQEMKCDAIAANTPVILQRL